MKLSKTQQKVIDLLKKGWELGSDEYTGHTWLQKDGLGCGGETEYISFATLNALQKRGLIKYIGKKFPTHYYQLTEKGKK